MIYRIIFKNFKSNLKNYVIYFAGNMIGVSEFFVFWGLYAVVQEMTVGAMSLNEIAGELMLSVGAVSVFSVTLMVYSMLNYMRLRLNDYGLFQMLGMKKKLMYGMIVLEYFAGWIVSLGVGLAVGRLMLFVVQKICHRMIPEYIKVTNVDVSVYMKASIVSFIIMLGVVFVVMIWAENHGVSAMMKGSQIKEKKPQSIWWSVCVLIGIALLVWGFFALKSSIEAAYTYAHLAWIGGSFLMLAFGGGILLEWIRKKKKFYYKNLLKYNQLYSKYQSSLLILLMLLSVHFIALGYCAANISALLPITGHEKYYPYDAICMMKGQSEEQEKLKDIVEKHNGKIEEVPMIRVSAYENELMGISESTYHKLSGKKYDLKEKEIIYILSEYQSPPGKHVRIGGFDYGKDGYTWLAIGSYTKYWSDYVSPESNHPIPLHDEEHLYKMRDVQTGNWFGKYRTDYENENIVVFSDRYFEEQQKKLSEKEYEPDTLGLIKLSDRGKEDALKELRQYWRKYGLKDFGYTRNMQQTYYITDDFLAEREKEDIFKVTTKLFIILAFLLSGEMVIVIKTMADFRSLRKRYEFLDCMGIFERMKKQVLNAELQSIPLIAFVSAVLLSATYLCAYILYEDAQGVVLNKKVWIYWLVIVGGYWCLEMILQKIIVCYVGHHLKEGRGV